MEEMDTELPPYLAEIGVLLGHSIPHENRTEHDHYRTHYDAETRDVAGELFAADVERGGYRF